MAETDHMTVAEMLAELAATPGGPCQRCDRQPWPENHMTISEVRASGLEWDWRANELFRRCEACAEARPYGWMLKIDPVKAEVWLKANSTTVLDKMIELVPETSPKGGLEFL